MNFETMGMLQGVSQGLEKATANLQTIQAAKLNLAIDEQRNKLDTSLKKAQLQKASFDIQEAETAAAQNKSIHEGIMERINAAKAGYEVGKNESGSQVGTISSGQGSYLEEYAGALPEGVSQRVGDFTITGKPKPAAFNVLRPPAGFMEGGTPNPEAAAPNMPAPAAVARAAAPASTPVPSITPTPAPSPEVKLGTAGPKPVATTQVTDSLDDLGAAGAAKARIPISNNVTTPNAPTTSGATFGDNPTDPVAPKMFMTTRRWQIDENGNYTQSISEEVNPEYTKYLESKGTLNQEEAKILAKGRATQAEQAQNFQAMGAVMNNYVSVWKQAFSEKKLKGGMVTNPQVAKRIGNIANKMELPGFDWTQALMAQKAETAISMSRIVTGGNRVIPSVVNKIMDSLPEDNMDVKGMEVKITRSLFSAYSRSRGYPIQPGSEDETEIKNYVREILTAPPMEVPTVEAPKEKYFSVNGIVEKVPTATTFDFLKKLGPEDVVYDITESYANKAASTANPQDADKIAKGGKKMRDPGTGAVAWVYPDKTYELIKGE